MTKRLFGVVKGYREHIADHTGRLYSDSEVADLLNTVYEENEQLKHSIKCLEADKMELQQYIKRMQGDVE